MQKWEYKVTTVTHPAETQLLNSYGADGWELACTSFAQEDADVRYITLYLKRPIPG